MFLLSVCFDTSFDHSSQVLLVVITIFSRIDSPGRIYREILNLTGLSYIHVRELSKRRKMRLLRAIRTILKKYKDEIFVRIIGLRIPKGTNRFRKYAFVERIVSKIVNIPSYHIQKVIVPSDLNAGKYKFINALEKRINVDSLSIIEDDQDTCVQLADAIAFLFRKEKNLPIEYSYSIHNC